MPSSRPMRFRRGPTSCRTRPHSCACRDSRSCRWHGLSVVPPGLVEGEAVAFAAFFGDDERRQAAVVVAGRIGAREQHEDIGAGGERAPRLGAVDAYPPSPSRGCADADAGDVRAVVGFGHRDGDHRVAGRERGNQCRFCASVPPLSSALVRISGRVMSDPPMPSEPARALRWQRPLRGSRLAAGSEAPILLGNRQAEAADGREALDHLFGNIVVVAVYPLCAGRIFRRQNDGTSRHQLEVVVEAAVAFDGGQAGDEAGSR